MNRIIVTGGAGFIGSHLVDHIIKNSEDAVCVIDKLTYAGNIENLNEVCDSGRFSFFCADICDRKRMDGIFRDFRPTHIFHLAAESHVDRSIDDPAEFIATNITGTYTLLEAALDFYRELPQSGQSGFRFLNVSTDEVYGDIGDLPPTNENASYKPSSPYSAAKAAADHLVSAWHRTYSLPTLTVHCSNNYGPRQFPEKLIPLIIKNALENKPLPIYGDGRQVRDWLFVGDCAEALYLAGTKGRLGEVYNIGGGDPQENIVVIEKICSILDEIFPAADGKSYSELMTFVKDRPGHDRRYALDCGKILSEFGWQSRTDFADGLTQTVKYYLAKFK